MHMHEQEVFTEMKILLRITSGCWDSCKCLHNPWEVCFFEVVPREYQCRLTQVLRLDFVPKSFVAWRVVGEEKEGLSAFYLL